MAEPIERDLDRGKRIKDARERPGVDLSQSELARRIGIDTQTVSRWERGYPIKPRDVAALARVLLVDEEEIDPEAAKRLGKTVPRGTSNGSRRVGEAPPAHRFPVAALLRLPDVRARLAAIQAELIEAGASPEQEENVMRTLRDRQLLSRFAGGSEDDQYTEAEILQAIDNIAEAARRFLSGPTL